MLKFEQKSLMDTAFKIAKNIRHFREMKNLTQSYMAERLDIDVKTYSKIEKGDGKITVDLIDKIAEILETSFDLITKFDSSIFFNISEMKDSSFVGYNNNFYYNQELAELKKKIDEIERNFNNKEFF